jgi:hypothetical protein
LILWQQCCRSCLTHVCLTWKLMSNFLTNCQVVLQTAASFFTFTSKVQESKFSIFFLTHYPYWEKLGTKGHILYDSIWIKCPVYANSWRQKIDQQLPGAGKREELRRKAKGQKDFLWSEKNVLELDTWWVQNLENILKPTKMYTSEKGLLWWIIWEL